ncbi:ankyrin repeat domain-containing protein 40 [Takifugu rubripes]|uniref:Ankyrin repeat domain 40 n=1 Tax=Takifugu rubripes TaxID=31033 RepID=A0A3B5K8E8_TAKRU|nr:ankyrin repeat domain-containing protein 40 [Takifugu rubripes]XP_056871740.1 ankyrin repeat domain-containing protein 40 [Takifugu flavidus]|eukprot:XP_003964591.1 PREDICTED: ankyrin repeat domain-containing protein 40 [Takifugu rubripes]
MSSISLDKELQERLREASAIGDIDEVRILVASGVNINSQNEINGWTCLHWACKRNHKHIVSYLLSCGADIEILTAKDELASQLTSKPEIKRLLGVEVEEVPEVKEPELPIIPNYLSNPPFMYSKLDNKSEVITDQHATQNGTRGCEEDSEPASLPPTLEAQDPHSMLSDPPAALPNPSPHRTPHASDLLPVAEQNGASPSSSSSHNHAVVNCTVPMDLSVEPHLINHADYQHVAPARNGAMCSPPLSSASSGGGAVQPPVAGAHPTMSRQQSIPQQLGHSQSGGAVPAFQPFFFTSTFPVNVQELVLKVRIQNPSARENDFIEVELDRQELTYRSLLRVCCRELGISAEHVEKIRKLPNTMLRKDKDVARLQDFQELEVVLEKAEGLSFFSGGGLTDRPCYNMKASRLTY